MPNTKLIILDRDGVINQDSDDFIKTPDEWLPIKGSLEAIALLSQAGYSVVVLSNQSGVGRALFDVDTLNQIHVRMIDYVHKYGGKVQAVLFCPHHPEDNCSCRKPKTGLYDELKSRLNTNLSKVFSVGDSLRDLQAAQQAGATAVLVKTGNGKKTMRELKATKRPELEQLKDCLVFDNLYKFTQALLAGELSVEG